MSRARFDPTYTDETIRQVVREWASDIRLGIDDQIRRTTPRLARALDGLYEEYKTR